MLWRVTHVAHHGVWVLLVDGAALSGSVGLDSLSLDDEIISVVGNTRDHIGGRLSWDLMIVDCRFDIVYGMCHDLEAAASRHARVLQARQC